MVLLLSSLNGRGLQSTYGTMEQKGSY